MPNSISLHKSATERILLLCYISEQLGASLLGLVLEHLFGKGIQSPRDEVRTPSNVTGVGQGGHPL